MYFSVIILVLVYTAILVYVYIRYNLDEKTTKEHNGIYREKLEISPSEAAYLIDKNCNSLNIILADILTLIDKGYIEMITQGENKGRDYIFSKLDNTNVINIKSHEMSSYKLFFQGREKMGLKEYLNILKSDKEVLGELELKISSIKNDIEIELRKQGITNRLAEKRLLKFNKMSIGFILIFLIVFIPALICRNVEIFEFSYIGLLFSVLLYKTTDIKEDKLTRYGTEIKNKAEGFRNFLQNYLITKNKPLYMVNVLEYNYTMAVAFRISSIR